MQVSKNSLKKINLNKEVFKYNWTKLRFWFNLRGKKFKLLGWNIKIYKNSMTNSKRNLTIYIDKMIKNHFR